MYNEFRGILCVLLVSYFYFQFFQGFSSGFYYRSQHIVHCTLYIDYFRNSKFDPK